MAKMNSRGASPSRLVPPGSCNQNAHPPAKPDDIPDKIISTIKSILFLYRPVLRAASYGLRATLDRLLAARSSWLAAPRNGNSSLLKPEILQLAGWNRRCRAPVSFGTAQKETDLIPKLNRMPDGSLGVKDASRNLPPRNVGAGRMARPNPGADGPH